MLQTRDRRERRRRQQEAEDAAMEASRRVTGLFRDYGSPRAWTPAELERLADDAETVARQARRAARRGRR